MGYSPLLLLFILIVNRPVKDFKQEQLKSCSGLSMEGPKVTGPSEEAFTVVWGHGSRGLSLSHGNGELLGRILGL